MTSNKICWLIRAVALAPQNRNTYRTALGPEKPFLVAGPSRLLRALQEAKRAAAKATKEKHAADVAAAELRGKAEAERDTQRMEVQMAQQQLEAAKLQATRLEADIKDYKARAQVGSWLVGMLCSGLDGRITSMFNIRLLQ